MQKHMQIWNAANDVAGCDHSLTLNHRAMIGMTTTLPVRFANHDGTARKGRRLRKRLGMYETFDHTADLGLRVMSSDVESLFAEAACGLFSMLVENLEEVRPSQTVEFRVPGSELDYLLFDWLTELLYCYESLQLLLCEFEVKRNEQGVSARARGEPVDRERHVLTHEVKAITYHQLSVEQTPDGWQAEVIVDI